MTMTHRGMKTLFHFDGAIKIDYTCKTFIKHFNIDMKYPFFEKMQSNVIKYLSAV